MRFLSTPHWIGLWVFTLIDIFVVNLHFCNAIRPLMNAPPQEI